LPIPEPEPEPETFKLGLPVNRHGGRGRACHLGSGGRGRLRGRESQQWWQGTTRTAGRHRAGGAGSASPPAPRTPAGAAGGDMPRTTPIAIRGESMQGEGTSQGSHMQAPAPCCIGGRRCAGWLGAWPCVPGPRLEGREGGGGRRVPPHAEACQSARGALSGRRAAGAHRCGRAPGP
jgi:hypothetical protein